MDYKLNWNLSLPWSVSFLSLYMKLNLKNWWISFLKHCKIVVILYSYKTLQHTCLNLCWYGINFYNRIQTVKVFWKSHFRVILIKNASRILILCKMCWLLAKFIVLGVVLVLQFIYHIKDHYNCKQFKKINLLSI